MPLFTLTMFFFSPASAAQAQPVVFVDFSWDSVQVHNRIAGYILEHGYGYAVEYLFADTVPGLLALERGDAHLSMEIWRDNIAEAWQRGVDRGRYAELGLNFPDAPQGWYVPTYLIEGDPERGIEPLAPDLRSVTDLARYWELFRDPEVPGKGRFYNAPNGWVVHDHNLDKLQAYGLLDFFVPFDPGSDAALVASMAAAYERGEPWVGYYWEPTWVMGLYDMTLLEEPPYSDQCWATTKACAFKPAEVLIGANARWLQEHPEVEAFLRRYETTLAQNNDVLAYMNRENAGPDAAARYFLRTYEEVWRAWVPDDVAQRVLDALAAGK
ncbi:MAG: ABC transporter substrate-binding protein [Limnochordales bacterium]